MRRRANLARRVLAGALLALGASALAGFATGMAWADELGPSFNCAKAESADEVAICGDDTLAMLDRIGAAAFAVVAREKGEAAAKGIARPALAARHACGSDAGCIRKAGAKAIAAYARLGAPLSATSPAPDGPPPTVPGACSSTRVEAFGPRLDGADYDTGTGIAFANGGGQVSYDREEGIIASRPGDPVEMCLLSLPKDCPPGDDRGKWYLTRNLRTGAVWALPDAAHVCGGA
jgi:uncharacterized protein